jgi:hypothetical protein
MKIKELAVHSFDGEFYEDTKRYLEKQGCIWSEVRLGDQLIALTLTLPPGTVCKRLTSMGDFDRHQLTFEKGGTLWWNFKRTGQINSIVVPYAYLGGYSAAV